MKKHFVLGLVTMIVVSYVFGCSKPSAAATPANSQATLPAIFEPCPTAPAESVNQTASQNPAPEISSDAPQNQVFLPWILSIAPPAAFCPAIQAGLSYLMARYNPALGLLNEAPAAAPHIYWLTNDNALAAYAFERLGQAEMSAAIKQSILLYGSDTNGLIEVVWGVPVTFPPYIATKNKIDQVGEDIICREVHDQGDKFIDWQEYADLGFYGALNEFQQGDLAVAQSIYANTLDQFDGTGFQDKAFSDLYATYKLALALYVGATIQAPNPYREQMLSVMRSMQSPNGGFFTHYRDQQTPEGDTNTETTSLALLALAVNKCDPP